MILVDTSAWVEFLRASGHPVHLTLREHLARRSPLATTEPIIMELLAGTPVARERARLRSRLLTLPQLRLHGLPDFERAADLYLTCRRKGGTVRRMMDCLIAAVAVREQAAILHNDRDFDVLVRHTPLRLASPTLKPRA